MPTEIEFNIEYKSKLTGKTVSTTLHKLKQQGVLVLEEFMRYEKASPFKGTKTVLVLYTINEFLIANPDYKVVAEAVIYG